MRLFAHKKPCHAGPVEVVKNLFCGSGEESLAMAAAPIRADTLVPLHELDATVWNFGFRGEVLYYPISDYGILPGDVLEVLVAKILDRLKRGMKVGIFCLGGHGRTGYIVSAVLGKLGHEDPIGFLRSKYCKNAVESDLQIQHIADFLEKPELAGKYAKTGMSVYMDAYLPDFIDFYDTYDDYGEAPANVICGECARMIAGMCQKYREFVDPGERAGSCFIKR